MGRRSKRQFNYSYELAKRPNVVLDNYVMSFVINTGIWLVSLDCLNTLITDKICDRKCGRSGTSACRHRRGRRNVKDNMPHRHKSPREIHS